MPYDTLFVYGEVSADEVHWLVKDGEFKRTKIETDG